MGRQRIERTLNAWGPAEPYGVCSGGVTAAHERASWIRGYAGALPPIPRGAAMDPGAEVSGELYAQTTLRSAWRFSRLTASSARSRAAGRSPAASTRSP